jgi:hypothetical protein
MLSKTCPLGPNITGSIHPTPKPFYRVVILTVTWWALKTTLKLCFSG